MKIGLQKIMFYWCVGLFIVLYESNRHKGFAPSYPNHRDVSRQFFVMFFILRGTFIVSHGIDFVTFLGFGSDKKLPSQISGMVRIVTKFVTKNTFSSQNIFYDPH